MRVAFRADASLEIGTGHVMRCLTLADALRERGASCRFVSRLHEGNLVELIRMRGHEVVPLLAGSGNSEPSPMPDLAGPAHSTWLGSGWRADAEQTCGALSDFDPDWLVVDHYALDAQWERHLASLAKRLMAVDDLADRSHQVDLLVDQNLGRQAADYARLVPHRCKVLAGPSYALLRPSFTQLRHDSLARSRAALRRLLVSMGGVDKDDVTGQVLRSLAHAPLATDCKIVIVLGLHAPWLDRVKEAAADLPFSTEVLVNAPDLAKEIAEADLAIGAAGTSALERCCLGLPTVTAVLAENQRAGARALAAAGAVLLLAEGSALSSDLPVQIQRAMEPGRMDRMQRASAAITDGEGTLRVVEAMNDANR